MKYRICQIKTCQGVKTNIIISSSKDINMAHKRVANTMNRIEKYGRHTMDKSYGCSKTPYVDRYGYSVNTVRTNCKAEFEVREVL